MRGVFNDKGTMNISDPKLMYTEIISIGIFEGLLMSESRPQINRLFLMGIISGFMLLALLYYPLAQVLPGEFIPEWAQGGSVNPLLFVLAAAILFITGYIGARFTPASTRFGKMVRGATAATIAGVLFHVLLGGATAGLIGSQGLLEHGMQATSDSEMMRLLGENLINMTQIVFITLWGIIGGSVLLGAAGGAIVQPSEQTDMREVRRVLYTPVSLAATLVTAPVVVFTALMFSILPDSLSYMLTDFGVSQLTIDGLFILPYLMVLIPYLLLNSLMVSMMRAEARAENPVFWSRHPLIQAVIVGWVGLAASAVPFWLYPHAIVMLGSAASFLLTLAFVWYALRQRKSLVDTEHATRLTQSQRVGMGLYAAVAPLALLLNPLVSLFVAIAGLVVAWRADQMLVDGKKKGSSATFQTHRGMLPTTAILFTLLSALVMPVALNFALIPVVMIPALVDNQSRGIPMSLTTMIQTNYNTQMSIPLMLFLVISVGLAIFSIAIWLVMLFSRRVERFAANRHSEDVATDETVVADADAAPAYLLAEDTEAQTIVQTDGLSGLRAKSN